MAHELSIRKNGFVEMAYVGEKPWHGLGQELKEGASVDEWQRAAGMDWKIQRAKVRFAVEADPQSVAALHVDSDNHVLFRSDTKAPLGIVSDGFKIVQPHETLEFFRDLVSVSGFRLCTAGVLKGGRKFWAQAEASLKENIVGKDAVEGKLLVATACDGTMKTIVKSVAERVVCANTLSMAMKESSSKIFQVSHRSQFDAQEAKRAMGLVADTFHQFVVDAREMAKADISPAVADHFILEVLCGLPMPDGAAAAFKSKEFCEVAKKARQSSGYVKVMELFKGAGRGSTAKGSKDTVWGLVNAVTEYVDHHRGRSNDTRLDYSWFGPGDALKTQAFSKAKQFVYA